MIHITVRVRPVIFAFILSFATIAVIATPITLAPHVGITRPSSLLRLFNLDLEGNVPAWVATVHLLIASGILWALAHTPSVNFGGRWKLLSGLFLAASLDEAASVHEMLIWPIREGFGLGGLFYFAWVVVAIPFVAFLAYWYWPAVRTLPRAFERWAMVSAGLYVSGAVGMEMIGGAWRAEHATFNVTYTAITCVEELMELGGLTLWNCTLLKYLELCHTAAYPRQQIGAARQ